MRIRFSRKLKNELSFQARLGFWHKVRLIFACVVVCITSYALILPALTLNGDYVCGMEAHTHGASCYSVNEDGEKVLICTQPEHQHDEHCLVQKKDPRAYVCGHAYEHLHEAGCWCDGVLVCTLEEHVHDKSCLPPEYQVDTGAVAEGEPIDTVTESGELLLQMNEEGLPEPTEQTDELPVPEDTENAEGTEEPEEPEESDEPGEEEELGDAEDEEEEELDAYEQLRLLRRNAATEANNTRALLHMDQSRSGDLPFEADPREEYVALESVEDATVSFVIFKPNTGETVDPELAHGSGFGFTLSATSSSCGNLLENYQLYGLVYYYKVYCPNFQLYMNQNDVPVPIEEYAADWVNINSAEMRVVRDESGAYWFCFRTANYITVQSLNITGFLVSERTTTTMALSKTAQWVSEYFAYEYTVTATIPHAVNDYSQYYYLEDITSLSLTGDTYDGFVSNVDNNFRVSASVGGGAEISLLPIDQAANDSSQDLAYYLDPDSGRLYLLNRTTHSGDHLVNPLPALLQQYPGWCLCWEQTSDVRLIVKYVDKAGQIYTGQHDSESFLNRAYLRDQGGNFIVADATPSTLGGLLKKTYSSTDKTFTIYYNSDFLDLSVRESETFLDVMINCVLPLGADPTVCKRASLDGELIPLALGTDYTYSRGEDGFVLTIYDLGPYQYLITYPVQLAGGASSEDITNTVTIGGTSIYRTITAEYGNSNSSAESTGWVYLSSLLKVYENGNPEIGADFGLYRASDDTLIAHSVVERANDGSGRLVRHVYFFRDGREVYAPMPDGSEVVYTPGAGYDEVYFHSAGLTLNTLYYMQELAAPEGYIASTRRFYFYATDPYTNVSAPEGIASLIANGESVTDINNWRTITMGGSQIDFADNEAGERCYNAMEYVDLPATGSAGALWIYISGIALALSPLVLVFKKLKRRGCTL